MTHAATTPGPDRPATISVGFDILQRPYMRQALQGVLDFAARRPGWRVIPGALIDYEEIGDDPPDGIISGVQTDNIDDTLARTVPSVLLEPLGLTIDQPWVGPDYHAIGRLAAAHFAMRGYATLVYFRDRDPLRIDANLIGQGIVDAAAERGLAVELFALGARTLAKGTWTLEDQTADLIDLLQSLTPPVGVIASDDQHGWVALEACRQHHIAVPDPVAVLGIGSAEFICEMCRPTLSSIALNHRRIGYEAAAILDRLLTGRKAKRRTLIDDAEVVTRQSTSHIASADPDVATAVRYIGEHLSEPLTVNRLAEAALVSPRTLLRRFKATLGRSPSEEVRRQRLEAAKQLIRDTTMPLLNVALETGFGQQSALGRALKADCGKTPAQLRRSHQR
jgi:LacI family transcriptional regulator